MFTYLPDVFPDLGTCTIKSYNVRFLSLCTIDFSNLTIFRESENLYDFPPIVSRNIAVSLSTEPKPREPRNLIGRNLEVKAKALMSANQRKD